MDTDTKILLAYDIIVYGSMAIWLLYHVISNFIEARREKKRPRHTPGRVPPRIDAIQITGSFPWHEYSDPSEWEKRVDKTQEGGI